MVQINFDANQVAPDTGFEPVPEGWYTVAISESEIKPTKDGADAYLNLKCSIIHGPQANKPLFVRLNIQNKNQRVVDIAYGHLSAICHAVGIYTLSDSSQLHGIPFQVKVVVKKSPEFGESNEVKGFRDAAGNEPGKAPQNSTPSNFGGTPAPVQAASAPAFGGASQAPQGQPPVANPNYSNAPATQPQTVQDNNTGWTQSPSPQGVPPWGNAAK